MGRMKEAKKGKRLKLKGESTPNKRKKRTKYQGPELAGLGQGGTVSMRGPLLKNRTSSSIGDGIRAGSQGEASALAGDDQKSWKASGGVLSTFVEGDLKSYVDWVPSKRI